MAKAKEKLKVGSPGKNNPLKTALAKITKPGKIRSPVKKTVNTVTKSTTKNKSPDPKNIVAKAVEKVRNLKKSSATKSRKNDGSASSGKMSPTKPGKNNEATKESKTCDSEGVKETKEPKGEQRVTSQGAKSPKTNQLSQARTEIKHAKESAAKSKSSSISGNDSMMTNKDAKRDKSPKGSPPKASESPQKKAINVPKLASENKKVIATPKKKTINPDIADSVKSSPRRANLKQSPRNSPVKGMSLSPVRTLARDSPIKKQPKLVKIRNVNDQDDVKEIKPVIKRRGSKSSVGLKSPTHSPASGKKSPKTGNKSESEQKKLDPSAKKEIKSEDSKDTKSEKSNSAKAGRLRTPKKLPMDIYKSRHNIGRRSAGRVCSYKETEIALLFPDDYQWSVSKIKSGKSTTRKNSIESSQTESDSSKESSYSDDDSEITFPKIEKLPTKQTTKSQSTSPARASKQTESKPKTAIKTTSKVQPKTKITGRDKNVYEFESEKEDIAKSRPISPSKRKTTQVKSNVKDESSDASSDDETEDETAKQKVGKSPKHAKCPTKAKVSPPQRRKSKYEDIRPRAPRIQRTACLNANAINSLLYDTRAPEKPAKVEEKAGAKDTEDGKGSTPKSTPISKSQAKKEENIKTEKEEKKEPTKPKKKRAVKRKPDEPEVMLWPPPKRMASLNAQAIMAACKELEDFKPEKIPKPPKETTPKEKKSKPRKSNDTTSNSNNSASNEKSSSRKSSLETATHEKVPLALLGNEPQSVRFVATNTSAAPPQVYTQISHKQPQDGDGGGVHSPHEYINVVDDGEAGQQGAVLSPQSITSSGTCSSSDVQIMDSPPQQQQQQKRAANQHGSGNVQASFQHVHQQGGGLSPDGAIRPKVSTAKPMPQYPNMPYGGPIPPQAPFAHGGGNFRPLYPSQMPTSLPSSSQSAQQSAYNTPSQPYPSSSPFDPQMVYPRHTSPYKQHPSIQNVPAYPPGSPYKSSYDMTSQRYDVSSQQTGPVGNSTPTYTQAQTPVVIDSSTERSPSAQSGFQSVRPGSTNASFSPVTTAVTQSGAAPATFIQGSGSVNMQGYPTAAAGYSVMGYPRTAFPGAHQGAFVNTGYQVLPGGHQRQGSGTSGGSGAQGNQAATGITNQAQGQQQNLYMSYGYYQPAGPLIQTVGPNPYLAMRLPQSHMKPYTQPIMAHTHPVQPLYKIEPTVQTAKYQSESSKASSKPLPIAPKPTFIDTNVEKRPGSAHMRSPNKASNANKADVLDLTKDSTEPSVRSHAFPSVVVTSHMQMTTQLIPSRPKTDTTKTNTASPQKETKDIMDLDSKKVKVHTGAVGEMERHSPIKIPRGQKSTSTGVPPKKPRLDTSAAKPPVKAPSKPDKNQPSKPQTASAIASPITTTASVGVPKPSAVKSHVGPSVEKTTKSSAPRGGLTQPLGKVNTQSMGKAGALTGGRSVNHPLDKVDDQPTGKTPTVAQPISALEHGMPSAKLPVPAAGSSKTTTVYSGSVMSTTTMPMATGSGIQPIMPMHFQARHVLPGQITMPRGPYHTRPLAVPRPAFNIQNMARPIPAQVTPPKPSTNQRKRPSEKSNGKPKTDTTTSKKALTIDPQSANAKTNDGGGKEVDGQTAAARLPKGSKSENTPNVYSPHVVQSPMMSPSKAPVKSVKLMNPAGKEKQTEKKVKKANPKSPKPPEGKAKADGEKSKPDNPRPKSASSPKFPKPNSPRQKSDPNKSKFDTPKQKSKPESPRQKFDSAKLKPESPRQRSDSKSKKEEFTKAPPFNYKSGASGAKSTASTTKKERRRSLDDRKMSPGNGGRRRLQSAALQSPPSCWQWEGQPELKQNGSGHGEISPVLRKCYPGIRHADGDVIRVRDCVLVKSGSRKKDIPFVAKIAALWEHQGEMMMSIFWYYRPEQTDTDRLPKTEENEIFASRHRDEIPVACIDDKAYVLTFSEFCRYKSQQKRLREGLPPRVEVVPLPGEVRDEMPTVDAPPETVFLCRKVYDVKLKRFLKNPQINSFHNSPMSSKAHSTSSKSPSPKAPTPPNQLDFSGLSHMQMSARGRPVSTVPSPMSPDVGVFVLHSANLPSFVPRGHVKVLKHDAALSNMDIALPRDLISQTSEEFYLSKVARLDSSKSEATSDDKIRRGTKFEVATVSAAKDKSNLKRLVSENASDSDDVFTKSETEQSMEKSVNNDCKEEYNEKSTVAKELKAKEDSRNSSKRDFVSKSVHSTDTAPANIPQSTSVSTSKSTQSSNLKQELTNEPKTVTAVPDKGPLATSERKTGTYRFVAITADQAKVPKSETVSAPETSERSFAIIGNSVHSTDTFDTYKFVAKDSGSVVNTDQNGGGEGEVDKAELHKSIIVKCSNSDAKLSSSQDKINSDSLTADTETQDTSISSSSIDVPSTAAKTDVTDDSSKRVSELDKELHHQDDDTISYDPVSNQTKIDEKGTGTTSEVNTSTSTKSLKSNKEDIKPTVTATKSSRKPSSDDTIYHSPRKTRGSGPLLIKSPRKARKIDLDESLESDMTTEDEHSFFEPLNTSSSTDDSECREGDITPEEIIRDMTIVEDGSGRIVTAHGDLKVVSGQAAGPGDPKVIQGQSGPGQHQSGSSSIGQGQNDVQDHKSESDDKSEQVGCLNKTEKYGVCSQKDTDTDLKNKSEPSIDQNEDQNNKSSEEHKKAQSDPSNIATQIKENEPNEQEVTSDNKDKCAHVLDSTTPNISVETQDQKLSAETNAMKTGAKETQETDSPMECSKNDPSPNSTPKSSAIIDQTEKASSSSNTNEKSIESVATIGLTRRSSEDGDSPKPSGQFDAVIAKITSLSKPAPSPIPPASDSLSPSTDAPQFGGISFPQSSSSTALPPFETLRPTNVPRTVSVPNTLDTVAKMSSVDTPAPIARSSPIIEGDKFGELKDMVKSIDAAKPLTLPVKKPDTKPQNDDDGTPNPNVEAMETEETDKEPSVATSIATEIVQSPSGAVGMSRIEQIVSRIEMKKKSAGATSPKQ